MLKKNIRRIVQSIGLYNHYLLFRENYFPSELQKKEKENIERAKVFYGQFVTKNNLCYDIGANIGNRTAAFLALGARVVAIEPQVYCFNYLKNKFKNKAEVINIGLDKTEGEKDFYIANFHAASSLSKDWITKVLPGKSHEVELTQTVKIQTSTLDKLIEKYGVPDFCKIDVEGYELQVLLGLSKPMGIISFEYTFPELKQNAIECINHLNKLGSIICNYSENESMELSSKIWLKPEVFLDTIQKSNFNTSGQGDIYVKFIN